MKDLDEKPSDVIDEKFSDNAFIHFRIGQCHYELG